MSRWRLARISCARPRTVLISAMALTDQAPGYSPSRNSATAAGTTRESLLRRAGAVEEASEHAVAAAISAAARAEAGPLPLAEGFRALPGLGARGTVDGRQVLVGRASLLAEHGMPVPAGLAGQCAEWERAGHTAVLAGWDGAVRGEMASNIMVADAGR